MSDIATYPVQIAECDQTFIIGLNVPEIISVEMDSSIQIINSQTYEGDYVVTPKAHEETILATEGLVMLDDVTVKKITYFETSNLSGKTVYIASEV